MSNPPLVRRFVIVPAAAAVAATSLALVQPSASSAATNAGQTGTNRTIHLRHQTTAFPKPGAVSHDKAQSLTEDGALTRYGHSNSARPRVTTNSTGHRVL